MTVAYIKVVLPQKRLKTAKNGPFGGTEGVKNEKSVFCIKKKIEKKKLKKKILTSEFSKSWFIKVGR